MIKTSAYNKITGDYSRLYKQYELNFPCLFQTYHFSFQSLYDAKKIACQICELYIPGNNYLELGLNEIFLNAIEHGNLKITSSEKEKLKNSHLWQETINNKLLESEHQHKFVHVMVNITPDVFLIQVEDQGEGFNWMKYTNKTDIPTQIAQKKYHGRGLFLANTLCFDKIEFSEKGNVIRCYLYFMH